MGPGVARVGRVKKRNGDGGMHRWSENAVHIGRVTGEDEGPKYTFLSNWNSHRPMHCQLKIDNVLSSFEDKTNVIDGSYITSSEAAQLSDVSWSSSLFCSLLSCILILWNCFVNYVEVLNKYSKCVCNVCYSILSHSRVHIYL